MSDLEKKLEKMHRVFHCSNCGSFEPKVNEYSEEYDAGFTVCCHEGVCKGLTDYKFGNEKSSVDACCWANAELKFKQQGVDILALEGIQRLENE